MIGAVSWLKCQKPDVFLPDFCLLASCMKPSFLLLFAQSLSLVWGAEAWHHPTCLLQRWCSTQLCVHRNYGLLRDWQLWPNSFVLCFLVLVYTWLVLLLYGSTSWPTFFGRDSLCRLYWNHCCRTSNSHLPAWPPPIADLWIIVWHALLFQLSNV